MGFRRKALEDLVRLTSAFAPAKSLPPDEPRKILVLRNNDIGDLLVVTPLFAALRNRFPDAEIIAGIGSWNRPVLESNPHVARTLEINAPWHNQIIRKQGVTDAISYICLSRETHTLRSERIDIGIDVLGSGYGSLLMMRAGIPFRLGVRGYAGGDSGVQRTIQFDPEEHVGRQALRFAEELGCLDLPEVRPQLFLQKQPESHGAIVIAAGNGLASKNWPVDHFRELVAGLGHLPLILIGSKADSDAAHGISSGNPNVKNLCGSLSLRDTFALIAGARLVISNSSMAMHAAAAFRRPAIVLLGGSFVSASQHHRQWGYPETLMLGREPDRTEIFTPDEVLKQVSRRL
jgi:ADP-heptose:LPS heptosyltransferase